MPKMGRPAVPSLIKELSGTLRKDRSKEGIKFDEISEVPKPEVWLSNGGKKYFKNICELMIDKKLLNNANVQLVAIMAEEFATYEEACRKLKDEGKTITIATKTGSYEQVSPWVGIRNQAQKNYKDIAALFGMDPISQQKIGPPAKADADEFDKMLNGYK
jgi:P27 family predicted phage terminase small subunit